MSMVVVKEEDYEENECSGCGKNLVGGEWKVHVTPNSLHGDGLDICRDCVLKVGMAVGRAHL